MSDTRIAAAAKDVLGYVAAIEDLTGEKCEDLRADVERMTLDAEALRIVARRRYDDRMTAAAASEERQRPRVSSPEGS